jgi:hypothetical protein
MARSVDLEGIADDGFGYTVKITAPGQMLQAPSNRMWRVPTLKFGKKKRELSSEDVAARYGLAIPMVTELNVAENRKAIAEK